MTDKAYVIVTVGQARERYMTWAESEDAARAKFENGELTKPFLSEVTDVEIESIAGSPNGDWATTNE